METSRSRRAAKQILFGTISLIGSLATFVFYGTFAYLHDMNAGMGLQACMLVVTGVAFIVAVMALVIGMGE